MAHVTPPRDRDGFEIAIVCALSLESDAVEALVEVDFHAQGRSYGRASGDRNTYTTGVLGGKPVVLAYPRDMGTLNAAAVASDMRYSFKNIQLALVVGVTGGAPWSPDRKEIVLGDVLISTSVIQYDFGRQYSDGFVRKKELESTLRRANEQIGRFLAKLKTTKTTRTVASKTQQRRYDTNFRDEFPYEDPREDLLFPSDHRHKHREGQACEVCSKCKEPYDPVCEAAEKASCRQLGCDTSSPARSRPQNLSVGAGDGYDSSAERKQGRAAKIFFGRVASGNGVIKSGPHRDKLMLAEEVIAFEMEGAGTWDQLPTVVVKSVCDYADSHKNKAWQRCAAATAAACAKAVLEEWQTSDRVEASQQVASHATAAGPCDNVPFGKNNRFVGRSQELEALERKLFIDRDCTSLSVVGLGGIGKTQIVLSFAQNVLKKHPEFSVFWLPVISAETIEQAFEEIAELLGLRSIGTKEEDPEVLVRRHLSNRAAGKWLLIVDNADSRDLVLGTEQIKGLVDRLPRSRLGLTMFTTRVYEVAQSLTGPEMIKVDKMPREVALILLDKMVVEKAFLDTEKARSELLDELEDFPLAVTQAAAYINARRIPVSRYVGLLKGTEQDAVAVLSNDIRDRTRYKQTPNAVASTWIVSFQHVVAHNPNAGELLRFMSCIEWKAIPYSILPRVGSDEKMTTAIGLLCSYSFISERLGEGLYDMHRLVHLATRAWTRRYAAAANTLPQAILHLSTIFPVGGWEQHATWRMYLPHVLRIREDAGGEVLEGNGRLYGKVGSCMIADRRPAEAVLWLEESCDCFANLDGHEHDQLVSQHELAVAYRANGQVKQAIELLENVVAVRKEVLKEDHPNQLSSQHELAVAYRANGQVKQAIELLENVVVVRKEVLKEDHPNQLALQHELAKAYLANGLSNEAIELLEHVVAVQKVLQENDFRRLASQHELARAYMANEQVKKAIEMLEHVVLLLQDTFREDHPNRLAAQHNLAVAYKANGQVKKASELLEHVVQLRQRTLREDHPFRWRSERELAQWKQAEESINEPPGLNTREPPTPLPVLRGPDQP